MRLKFKNIFLAWASIPACFEAQSKNPYSGGMAYHGFLFPYTRELSYVHISI